MSTKRRKWDWAGVTSLDGSGVVQARPAPHELHDFTLKDPSVLITVEIRRDRDNQPVATGISVRRRHEEEKPADPQPVSAREMQRLPLPSLVRVALAQASRVDESERFDLAAIDLALEAHAPRPRYDDGFYKAVASTYRRAARDGLSPAKVLAEEGDVSSNVAHAWIHRARAKGFLEPAPPRKQARR